jgi:hypothetical protein
MQLIWSPSGQLEKRGEPGGAARGAHALLLHRPPPGLVVVVVAGRGMAPAALLLHPRQQLLVAD